MTPSGASRTYARGTMAGSTERTSSRRRAWDTAAVLLSVLLVTLGTVYLGSNYTGPVAPVAFGLLLGGQAILARYRPLTAWVVLVAAMTLFARTAIADEATTAWRPTVMFSAVVVLFGVAVVHRRSVAPKNALGWKGCRGPGCRAWVCTWCVVSEGHGRQRWGYHQLAPDAARRIVAAADVRPGELVLDLGAGTGGLTAPLLRAGARVIAVELHPGRAATLVRRYQQAELEVRVTDLVGCRLPTEPFRVVANPPWAVAETLRTRLLGARLLTRADLLLPRWLVRRWAGQDPRVTAGISVRADAFRPSAPTGTAIAVLQPRPGHRRRRS